MVLDTVNGTPETTVEDNFERRSARDL